MPVPAGLVLVTSQLCQFLWWLPRLFSFARCFALEGLSCSEVVSVSWDPHPWEPVFFRCGPVSPSHYLALRWFQSCIGRVGVGPQLSWAAVVGSCSLLWLTSLTLLGRHPTAGFVNRSVVPSVVAPSEVAVPVVRRPFSRGCSMSLVVTPGCSFLTWWRSGMLGACVVRLWSHVVAPVFRVVFCPTLVVGHGITLFRCFFLLLWMVRDWLSLLSLVREAHPPTLFSCHFANPRDSNPSGSSDSWVAARPSGSLAGVREVASFPAGFKCELQESVAAVAVVNFGDVLPEFFSVGSGGSEVSVVWLVAVVLPSRLRCIAWFPCVLVMFSQIGWLLSWCVSQNGALVVLVEVLPGPACVASTVLLTAVFSRMVHVVWLFGLCVLVKVLPRIAPCRFWHRTTLGAFGGGSPQSCPVVVLVVAALSLCRDELSLLPAGLPVVFLFVFEFLGCAGGTSCVPAVGWFASFLAPCMLSQMVVWPVACLLPLLSVGCSGWWCFHMAFGAVSRTVATFVAKGSVPYIQCEAAPGFLLFGLLVQALFGVYLACASAVLWRHLSPFGGWPSLPVVVGAVPCVSVLLRAIVVVALLKLLGFANGVANSALFGSRFLACGFWQVALSVVRQVLAAACARVFPLAWERMRSVGVPYFSLGPSEVDVLRCVSLSDHEDDLGEIEWCRWTLSCVPCVSGRFGARRACGVVDIRLVVVMTTGKSWYDLTLKTTKWLTAVPCVLVFGRWPFWGFPEGVPCVPRLSLFSGTPILGSLLREFSGLRACSISPSHCFALRWFRSRVGRVGVGPQLGWAMVVGSCSLLWLTSLTLPGRHPTAGFVNCSVVPSVVAPSEVAVLVVRHSFSHGCSVSLVVTPSCSFPTSWRSGMLGACVVRLWSHVVAPVFRELLCLGGCVPRCCFHIVFDSAGSAGVMFGPTLVSSFDSALLEFLLLWLIRDWLSLLSLVREAHPPYSLQVGTRYHRSSLPDGGGGGLLLRVLPAV
ncbi:hypothetical protein Taro_029851 [Colocasia esculenta]|uniref:Uncharacterized protein n=1 Tax=Colocasia esculenta TaxID=4460 RepID=A0A843VSD3_COLES|nr:hypothetical protein [Colocasia esculenta]